MGEDSSNIPCFHEYSGNPPLRSWVESWRMKFYDITLMIHQPEGNEWEKKLRPWTFPGGALCFYTISLLWLFKHWKDCYSVQPNLYQVDSTVILGNSLFSFNEVSSRPILRYPFGWGKGFFIQHELIIMRSLISGKVPAWRLSFALYLPVC